MKSGMMKGLITGMALGGAAMTLYGVMNWQQARGMNRKAKQAGGWIAEKAEDITKKM